jgi:hypothetical protein
MEAIEIFDFKLRIAILTRYRFSRAKALQRRRLSKDRQLVSAARPEFYSQLHEGKKQK